MSNVLSLHERKHDAEAVFRDLQGILATEPELARDGLVVIMLNKGADGSDYNTTTLSSDMRRMEMVALLEMIKFDMLNKVAAVYE